jgi:hypothetical protein
MHKTTVAGLLLSILMSGCLAPTDVDGKQDPILIIHLDGGTLGSTADASNFKPSVTGETERIPDGGQDRVEDPADASRSDALVASDADLMPDSGQDPVGDEVFIYFGANGWGPRSYLGTDDLEIAMEQAQPDLVVDQGDVLPSDTSRLGLIIVANPQSHLEHDVRAAIVDLVLRGGRVFIVGEHCDYGCYVNVDAINELLDELGAGLRIDAAQGTSGRHLELVLAANQPLLAGVSTLISWHSSTITLGPSTIALATDPDDADVVIAVEDVGRGQVVLMSDANPIGSALEDGDGVQFVLNLSRP